MSRESPEYGLSDASKKGRGGAFDGDRSRSTNQGRGDARSNDRRREGRERFDDKGLYAKPDYNDSRAGLILAAGETNIGDREAAISIRTRVYRRSRRSRCCSFAVRARSAKL
jgi:hypothetical protein